MKNSCTHTRTHTHSSSSVSQGSVMSANPCCAPEQRLMCIDLWAVLILWGICSMTPLMGRIPLLCCSTNGPQLRMSDQALTDNGLFREPHVFRYLSRTSWRRLDVTARNAEDTNVYWGHIGHQSAAGVQSVSDDSSRIRQMIAKDDFYDFFWVCVRCAVV